MRAFSHQAGLRSFGIRASDRATTDLFTELDGQKYASQTPMHACIHMRAHAHSRVVSDGYIDFGEFATAFFGTDAKKSLARTTDWVRQNKQVVLRSCNRMTFLNTRWQLTQQAVARRRQMMQMEVRPSR